MHSGPAGHIPFADLNLQRMYTQTVVHSVLFSSHQQLLDKQPPNFSPDDAVAANAANSTMISVVVLWGPPTPPATVSGLCPLLHQQEFPSRPQDEHLNSMTRRPRRTCQAPQRCMLTISLCTGLGVPSHTQWDPWPTPRFTSHLPQGI